jgi:outer membrane protein assembly factor BamB
MRRDTTRGADSDGARGIPDSLGRIHGRKPRAALGQRLLRLGVNLASRQVGWRYQNPQRQFPYYSSAAIIDARVVVGGRDKMVHCLDAYTGRAHWTFGTQARVESSPAIAAERVFVGSNDGRLYVLDFRDGRKVAEFNLGAPVSASPAIATGRVVVGAQDGKLHCFG